MKTLEQLREIYRKCNGRPGYEERCREVKAEIERREAAGDAN